MHREKIMTILKELDPFKSTGGISIQINAPITVQFNFNSGCDFKKKIFSFK